jgi:hypothetical protein
MIVQFLVSEARANWSAIDAFDGHWVPSRNQNK